MAKEWPVEEFREYLRSLMDEAGIANYAELSRQTGVGEHQLSLWRRGLAQPSNELLRRIATGLDVPLVKLLVAAGHTDAEELELEGEINLRATPREVLDLLDVYANASPEDLPNVRQTTSFFIAGLRAQLNLPKFKPSGRRRAG